MNIIAEVAKNALRWTKSPKHGRTSNVADIDNRVSCTIARAFAERVEATHGITIPDGPLGSEPGTQLQNLVRDWLNIEIRDRSLEASLEAAK